MLTSPTIAVTKRELLSTLRSGRLFLFLAGMVAITGLLLVPNMRMDISTFRGVSAGFALSALAMSLHVAGLLVLPALGSLAICLEMQRDTWPLLRTTLAPAWQVVLAKILSITGIYLLLILDTLPMVGLLFFFVGIDPMQYVYSLVVVVLAGVMTASVAVCCSAIFYRTLPAIAAAYIAAIALNGGLAWLFAAFLSLTGNGMPEMLVYVSAPTFVLTQWSELSTAAGYGVVGAKPSAGLLLAACPAYLFMVSWIAYQIAVRMVRRAPRPAKVRQEKPIDDVQMLEARRKQFPYYLIDPARRREPIADHTNPMLAKELIAGIIGRGALSIRIAYSLSIVFFILSLAALAFFFSAFAFVLGLSILLWVITPAFVAAAFTTEDELGNMDMLRMTLLAPREVFYGKLFASLLALAPAALGMCMGSLPLMILEGESELLLQAIATGASTLLLVFAIAVRMSVAANGVGRALIHSYLCALFVLFILPLVGLALWGLMPWGMPGTSIVLTVMPFGPQRFYPSPLLQQFLRQGVDLGPSLLTTVLLAVLFLLSARRIFRLKRFGRNTS